MIGGLANYDLVNPMDNRAIKPQADFSTGATALSFDFNKRAFGKTGVEMVYLDDQCCLKSRQAALDESCELYKQLMDDVKKNDRRVKEARQIK
jgi:hypothetical protein